MEETILDKAIEDAGRVCRLACRMAEAETSVDWCDSMVESDGVLLIYEVVELFCCAVTRTGRCHGAGGVWFGVRFLTPLFFPPFNSRFSQ